MGPTGVGDDTITVFDTEGRLLVPRLVEDPQLSPLDLTITPNGNIVLSREWPFGAEDAISSVREYDSTSGRLVRMFTADESVRFRNPGAAIRPGRPPLLRWARRGRPLRLRDRGVR